MKILEVRGHVAADGGEVRVRPGTGLVGWVGGSARERQEARDFLLRALGPASREDGEPAGEPTGAADGDGPQSTMARLRVRGDEVTIRDGRLSGGPGSGACLAALLGMDAGEWALAWAGGPGAGTGALLSGGARLLARVRGLGRIEGALAALGEPVSPDFPAPTAGGDGGGGTLAELREVEERLGELDDVPERLRTLEEELRALRADAAEVSGDMEAATMDWLRERQDAETQLGTYRDRARELRDRIKEMEESGPEGPCPFCGRTLGSHHAEVLSELRDEWERLVQDGGWWRRRREQLELKPARVRELEGSSVRLQAAVEGCAERLERCRFELQERDELRGRRRELRDTLGPDALPGASRLDLPEGGPAGSRRRTLVGALLAARAELVAEAEKELARAAGECLNRITGGRILALLPAPGHAPVLLEDGRRLASPTEEDRSAAIVALRVALARRLAEAGTPFGSILLGEVVRGLDSEARLRTVEVLKALTAWVPQVLIVSGDEVVDAAPERFDRVVEIRRSGAPGGPDFRVRPAGVGKLRVVTTG